LFAKSIDRDDNQENRRQNFRSSEGAARAARTDGRRCFHTCTDFRCRGLTGKPENAFFVGLAASLGAGVSMGLAEALSDDGSVTGRGGPIVRGAITGIATAVGGMLHTFPFLISNLAVALDVAYAVVVGELIAIAFIRYRFMSGNLWTTIGQVIVGGGIVFAIGIWLGHVGAGG
jgi:VIT1/CCC1 family predicted Fe2+/Mn2+ transporter